jgi:uncharacterized protein YbcI
VEEPERSPEPVDPDPHPEGAFAPSPEAAAASISRDLMAIHRDSYGRAAQDGEAYLVGDNVIVILNGLELLPNEEFMVSQGRGDAVRQLRGQYQKAIEPTFRAAVERATGRRVIGFASHTQLDEQPRFALEVFRLEPSG